MTNDVELKDLVCCSWKSCCDV